MKKTLHDMFDTGSLSLNTLKTIKTDSITKFNNEGDFRKCSIDIINILFPKKKHRGSLNPLYSRIISGCYISNFRSLSKRDKLQIITDSNDSNDFSEDTKFKCGAISLNDVCTYDMTSISITSQGFRHLITEALRNFASFLSTSIYCEE